MAPNRNKRFQDCDLQSKLKNETFLPSSRASSDKLLLSLLNSTALILKASYHRFFVFVSCAKFKILVLTSTER